MTFGFPQAFPVFAVSRHRQPDGLNVALMQGLVEAHVCAQPLSAAGVSPWPQPALVIPKPGSLTITEPSALTCPVPAETNCSRSWSYWNISETKPGGSACVFGSVTCTGTENRVPAGCNVQIRFGAVPLLGSIGTRSDF